MSASETESGSVDGEPPSLYPRFPSWEPASGEKFSRYDELFYDLDYKNLVERIKRQRKPGDQEIDEQTDAAVALRRLAMEHVLDHTVVEPKPTTMPQRVLEFMGIRRFR